MPQPSFLRARRTPLRIRGAALWACASLAVAAGIFGARSAQAESDKDAAQPASTSAAKRAPSKPLWRDLTARQQRALQPLAAHWDGLSEPHKRKWLVISRNYAKLSADEQATLHSRMTDWASLSNQERAQARLNFAEVKQIPVDERKAKWEAYQALSDEEKSKLAARAAPRPPGAAPTIRPVPLQKLAPVPTLSSDGQHTPRIELAPPMPASRPPLLAAPAPSPMPIGAPVSAEAQVPPPSALSPGPSQAEAPAIAVPAARFTEQPSAAP